MPRLIRNRQIVTGDRWVFQDADASLPQGAVDLVLPLDQYAEQREQLRESHQGRLGLVVDGTVTDDEIAPLLDELALVAIDFPSFTDGRGYSLARQLRQRHGYRGELRAVGNVLRDQLAYMERVGFDSFLLEAGRDTADALKAFGEFSAYYQNAPLDQLPRLRRRQQMRAA